MMFDQRLIIKGHPVSGRIFLRLQTNSPKHLSRLFVQGLFRVLLPPWNHARALMPAQSKDRGEDSLPCS
jgi:hypothetical protein